MPSNGRGCLKVQRHTAKERGCPGDGHANKDRGRSAPESRIDPF